MEQYDHKKIEKKWQSEWEKAALYKMPDQVPGKDNFYLLVEFPYPSGNLHVGHWYSFAVPDIIARAYRMQGKNVMYPIGFDAFGLPAENAAIKNKLNPRDWTEQNIAYMTKQLKSMGASFDWSREVRTIDPEYYKWTQWQFLQFHKNGLVYQKETAVNWCPKDKTVLANEQVVDGKCERCDSVVEQKMMLQWNIKITDYADRLIDDLETLDWPREIKESQKNWIGRSEGAEIDFPLAGDHIKRIILLHGKGGTSEGAWKPWMKDILEKRGYEVHCPSLPNSAEPNDEEQADYLQKNYQLDEKTAIVGHSFGGIVALRLLERGVKLGRVTLVATPFSSNYIDGKDRPTVTKALKKGFDFKKIKANCKGFIAIYDTHDHVVPMSDGEMFAQKLGCYLMRVKGVEPHLNGDTEPDVLLAVAPALRIFTTRPDTLYGATYLVLAPEHPWVTLALQHKTVLKNNAEVRKYVEKANKKTELERLADQKEKTGVQLEGVEAINPATGGRIPLYVADYVLATYGTGAIMAVPAHDERDFDFAKKFDIPIRQVVAPVIRQVTGTDAVHPDEPFTDRIAVMCIVKHWAKDEYLCQQWKEHPEVKTFVSGGIEAGEDSVSAGLREIVEESGYTDAKFIRQVKGYSFIEFFHQVKKKNIRARFTYQYYELQSDKRTAVTAEEEAKHTIIWKKRNEVRDFLHLLEKDAVWDAFERGFEPPYTGDGVLVNSEEFDGMHSREARKTMVERFGRAKKTYKLRDWIVSRQRYWGVPIPIIHCEKCGSMPVSDADLPVRLPDVEDYLPSGEGKSPLAKVTEWVNVQCPQCGGGAKRETDTLDTFVDSSWYFLRYPDPKNKKEFAARERQNDWMPVDLYSGGAEHTTMHLLYSRFWHKALYDLKLVADPEPYARRMNRSLILGPDGQKMSKSRGNVIDPDEVVERLGADTVRLYLAFIGPYNEVSNYPWNPNGVVGVRRFLERVARLEQYVGNENDALAVILNKTIKKVTEDIAALKFNTAISQMMILLNEIEAQKVIGKRQWQAFIKLLAPFAPHLSEELWHAQGGKSTVHEEAWPRFDETKLRENTVVIAIQIDGKTRGEVRVTTRANKEEQETVAREAVAARLEGQGIARTIVVPGRLVNFVLKK